MMIPGPLNSIPSKADSFCSMFQYELILGWHRFHKDGQPSLRVVSSCFNCKSDLVLSLIS